MSNMNNNDSEPNFTALLTPRQVADILAIPVSTLSRWRNEQRELPWVKVGRVVRYRPEDVRQWVDRHTNAV